MNTFRMPRGAVRLATMMVALAAAAGVALAGTPPATNQLQDIPVFKDQLLGTWSGEASSRSVRITTSCR